MNLPPSSNAPHCTRIICPGRLQCLTQTNSVNELHHQINVKYRTIARAAVQKITKKIISTNEMT
ncbi:MAG: hypothetical protein LBT46_01305 [Planctomycetaceae bacterium]|nr:hypothetical protein [Planctomycetaceae bacterium]